MCIYIFNVYMYIWSRVPCSLPFSQWYGCPGSTPFPSICKLLAAFLRSSLVFARSLRHFWLPASHLLGTGTCYLLDDLRSTHSPSKYLRVTCSHIYMCVQCIYSLYIYTYIHTYIHMIDTYDYICTYIHTYTHIHYITLHYTTLHYITLHYVHACIYIYIHIHIHIRIRIHIHKHTYTYTKTCIYIYIYIYIQTYTYILIHTYIHIHIHKHTHTYT